MSPHAFRPPLGLSVRENWVDYLRGLCSGERGCFHCRRAASSSMWTQIGHNFCFFLLFYCHLGFVKGAAKPSESCPQELAPSKEAASFTACLCKGLQREDDDSSLPLLVLPTDPSYSKATLTYNVAIQNRASAIVYPSRSEEVSIAVACASRFNVQVVGRGGGHSYASFSSGQGSLVVDLVKMQSLSRTGGQNSAWVGAGFRLGDLTEGLARTGQAIGYGLCPYVGVSGHALCGGFGMASRGWGLLLDQVEGMEVVTANGSILIASGEENPDLFYAMRGAGPFFGIVTSLNLITHPAPKQVVELRYAFEFLNPETSATALEHFATWATDSAPPELGIRLTASSGSRTASSGIRWSLWAFYQGSEEVIVPVLDAFVRGFPRSPMSRRVTVTDWVGSLRAQAKGQTLSAKGVNPSNKNDTYYAKSLIIFESDHFSKSNYLNFTSAVYGSPQTLNNHADSSIKAWFIEIDLYGGRYKGKPTAIKSFDDGKAAYAPRNGLLLFQFGGYGSRGDRLDRGKGMQKVVKILTGFYDSLGGGRREGTGYQCYTDYAFTAERAHHEYYGTTISRKLSALKETWDPQRVFRSPQGF